MTTLILPLETINLLDLTPTSFVLLNLLHNKENINLYKYHPSDIELLIERGYLNSDLSITSDGQALFNSQEDYERKWEEFINLYPSKVGNRRLHTDKDKNKKKFINYLKRGIDFTDIMQGLRNEIEVRNTALYTNEFIPAWKNLSTYVNNQSWQEYLDNPEEEIEKNDNII